MAKLKIVTGEDNPILRAVSKPVVKFDSALKKFVKELKEAMFAAKGIGIAAPQVGKNIRVFLAVFEIGKDDERIVPMVNPEILEFSKEMLVAEEGCLSLPGIYGKVRRAKKVKIAYQGLDGVKLLENLQGMNARVVQHELDHLNGVLFIDKLVGDEVVDEKHPVIEGESL